MQHLCEEWLFSKYKKKGLLVTIVSQQHQKCQYWILSHALFLLVCVTVETTLSKGHSSMAQLSRFIQSLNNPEFSSSPSTTKTCFNRSGIEMKFCLASLAADEEQECGRVKKILGGVPLCQRSSNFIFLFSTFVFSHFFKIQRWPTVGDYIPPLSLLWLSFCLCTFFSCLPSPRAVSPSPLPPLPSHFSLSL